MSEIGSLSGKLQRESELLRDLNDALLILEVDALGRRSEFGFSAKDVSRSRRFIADFAGRLCLALTSKSSSIDMQPIVNHFKSSTKPIEDWVEDMSQLVLQISNEKIADKAIPILEDILSLLDDQFTEDLQRLYAR